MRVEAESGGEDASVARTHRGTNQAGMRARNERLVLSLVRRGGPLAKTDIARLTGLSAQTVSVIMRKLEADRLLKRGEPQRGRVGQPSVPLALDPEGAFFLGAKIGRRSLDVVLVDFAGAIRGRITRSYAYPDPQETVRSIAAAVSEFEAELGAASVRIAGLGLAMPFALWSWADELGTPAEELDAWRHADVRAELAALMPYPVYLQNDATAACGVELTLGGAGGLQDFLYFHVGTFIGGGLVLNGGLFAGRTGNAAAVGSMPVQDGRGRTVQLIDVASLVVLERRLLAAGRPASGLYDPDADWSALGPDLDEWIAGAAGGIAQAVAAASAVIDLEAAIIDGPFPPPVLARLLAAIGREMDALDLSGLEPPQLRGGTLGPIARALGGASLPLFDRYLVEQHALAGAAAGRSPEAAGQFERA